MENQTPESVPTNSPAASTPVTPAGTAYVPPATSPPISIPVVPPPTPPKTRKWMMILGFLILILLVGTGGYLYVQNTATPKQAMQPPPTVIPSPTTLPTATPMASNSATASSSADWKTYKDTTYMFEIATPPSWYSSPTSGLKESKLYPGDTFGSQNYDPDNQENFDSKSMSLSDKVINPLRIDVGITTSNKNSLETIKKSLIKDGGSPGGESVFVNLEKVTETQLNNQPALLATYKNKSIKQLYILNNKNYLYVMDIYADPTIENDKLIDKILSSFKFTK